MLKLFAVQLGGRAPGCNTELHDTVFVVGETLAATHSQLRHKWFGIKTKIHIDSSVELNCVDGYAITLNTSPPNKNTHLHLFFINFGAYRTGFFGEIHQVNFYIAEKRSAAIAKAKQELCTQLSQQHGDDYLSIDDITAIDNIDQYYIHLEKTSQPSSLQVESCYRKLS